MKEKVMEMERKELLDINIDYLDKINIPNYKFGIEIEFAGAIYKKVMSLLDEILGYDVDTIEKIRKLEKEKENYEKWRLIDDCTVQDNKHHQAKKGGEINSPIITNEKERWQELKLICEMLRTREYIRTDERCGIHIHTEKTIYDDIEEYKNLVKLWILYEDIIYRFGYGEKNAPRENLLRFARPFSFEFNLPPEEILKGLNTVETKRDLVKLLRTDKKYGLNLTRILDETKNLDVLRKPTIEIRIYNGTLNENIIQNDVRFNMKLLEYCKKENFDKEFIEYKLKQYEPFYINDSVKEKPEKAEEFFKMICKDELDRLKLLKQYYKIYNENDIEKTLHL